MVRKIRPCTTCSLKVRKKRSMTPLVSGCPTKEKLGSVPQALIWFWKSSAMKALPWSWRKRHACMEDVNYRTPRGFDRALFQSLGGAPDTASLVGGAAPGARAPPVDSPPRHRRP